MPHRPRIAVVIPARNAAETLPRAVDSILSSANYARENMGLQPRVEIVAVDDGSTDATAAVIDALAARLAGIPDLLFKGVSEGTNRGAAAARNEGVRRAASPFIAFLDADDEFLPPHLGLCLKTLLADSAIGYVWTRRRLDVPMHPSWGPSLDASTVMNLCVRRIWHEIAKGFPEQPEFRNFGAEDSFYRIVLRALVAGRGLADETVLIHASPGNSLDRQKEKLATPLAEWRGVAEAEPPEAIVAALQERLAYVERLKAEMAGG